MDVTPVTLSTRAAEEIRRIMQQKKIPDGYGLRVGIRGGSGCGAAQLILGFDKGHDSDTTYTEQGITVHVKKKDMLYVIGKRLVYQEDPDARGFIFEDSSISKS